MKAWLAGWATLFVPSAVCWHKVGATSTTPEGARVRRRGGVEGRLVLATRHLPAVAALMVWGATIGAWLRDSLAGRSEEAKVAGHALLNSVSWLPAVLRERKRLYRSARTSPRRQIRWLQGVSAGTDGVALTNGSAPEP
jgi:hypothetical protein